ncbi:hypothetical protein rsdtw13_06540 [Clostridium sp. TW13]|uniref:Uncharacterized protein n=1 Tax=Inconstantimicrobium mannanitabidum TaxID=1604901 RepID=A0ACB5R8P1_9CLOT|nr:hypothetical protein rsdtw13_06540 [Clostridium sp. TW13]
MVPLFNGVSFDLIIFFALELVESIVLKYSEILPRYLVFRLADNKFKSKFS